MSSIQVKVGDTFRSAYADSNALWRVTRVDGDVAHCVIENEPWEHNGVVYDGDYAGVRKPFYVEDAARAIRAELAWKETFRQQDEFYASLKPGQIVHYHNGFGEFVRCEVVILDEDIVSGPSKYAKGDTVLQPVALVGRWKEHDLPHMVVRDGVAEPVIPYHAKKVLSRTGAWRASASCVFEAPGYSEQYRRQQGDPTGLEPIDLLANLSQDEIDEIADLTGVYL